MYLDQRRCVPELCAAELAPAMARQGAYMGPQGLCGRELLRANITL